ncbi:thiamine diphosphokinase [Arcticibacterium luteifluviistationis]|uniref:Thiamine diphosphokinase n=1 Tax=Arcticibacterium luteifluviistationis TaxID=1784714 RepID=A0A2Z4GE34_9BACT|nr:thiamine diphosphokinase [Arcticibacterium luteifluviistationis]AWV99444.1 thiamine diphosphokinase [Arcticibacterium luteifluviistationis]
MSSHHIVKDKQEPALLIANGAACKFELMEELLGWSPYVVVLDGAIDRVLSLGIKVDVLLGDFDKGGVKVDKIKEEQFPIEIVHTPDQDKTDLEKGIEFLIEKGFPAVNILWATGRRMDHTIANLLNLIKYNSKIKLVMLDDYSKIIPLEPGVTKFEKWYKAGTVISLIPVPKAEKIETSNLKYQLDSETLEIGLRLGNSNEVEKDGLMSVKFEKGKLFLMECND